MYKFEKYCEKCGSKLIIVKEGELHFNPDIPDLPWYRNNKYACPNNKFFSIGHDFQHHIDFTQEYMDYKEKKYNDSKKGSI